MMGGGVGVFNNAFIDSLFDLVEQTREMQDETFNYSVIKLIVSSLSILHSFYLIIWKLRYLSMNNLWWHPSRALTSPNLPLQSPARKPSCLNHKIVCWMC